MRVCLKGVGVNSIRCTQCVQWVHARCSRVKGSLKKVDNSFICRRCKGELSETRQVNGLHIDGHEYEIVDKLCYLGDMLSQEGGCEHAILKRIQTGWLKFRELSGLLIGKGMSLRAKEIIYIIYIRPALYGSETWATKVEDIRKMQRSEMRMLRWMTRVSLSERKSNECVRSMLTIDDVAEVMRRNRLRWFGHVERRDELCCIKRIGTLQVDEPIVHTVCTQWSSHQHPSDKHCMGASHYLQPVLYLYQRISHITLVLSSFIFRPLSLRHSFHFPQFFFQLFFTFSYKYQVNSIQHLPW